MIDRKKAFFWHYLNFTVATMVLAIVGLSVVFGFKAADSGENPLEAIVFLLALSMFPGFIVWGPILAVALFPGIFIFRYVMQRLLNTGMAEPMSAGLAAVVISIASCAGLLVPAVFYGDISDIAGMSWVLLFGIPAAAIAGYLVLGRKEIWQ